MVSFNSHKTLQERSLGEARAPTAGRASKSPKPSVPRPRTLCVRKYRDTSELKQRGAGGRKEEERGGKGEEGTYESIII